MKRCLLTGSGLLGDPRWGRCYESYGEAAKIVSEMSSFISGLQGEPPEEHPNGYPFLAGRCIHI